MPYIEIKLAKNEAAPITREMKQELISGITSVVAQVLGRNSNNVMIHIDEDSPDNWGLGGMSISQRRGPSGG